MKRLISIISIALTLAVSGYDQAPPTPTNTPTSRPPTSTSPLPTSRSLPPTPDEIAKSSVRIDAFVEEWAWWGSGTILTADGQILTNAHVVAGAGELIISLTSDVDQPPIPTYYAEPIEVDYVLDLAVIQITTDLDGNEVVRSELDLPALELGNSDDIALGQGIHILGYPGIGHETVTFTEGTVSGFVSEDLGNGSERVWIKTDTDIAPGGSGGTAVDDRGLLVGIPTAGVGSEMETLGYLRPINLAGYVPSGSCVPFVCDASIYEPNDNEFMAYGPLDSKTSYTAYIHENDVDVYNIEVITPETIEINLTDIAGDVDYDLVLTDATFQSPVASKGQASSEHICHSPQSTGTYYIMVVPYQGYSLQEPYVLEAKFNGDSGCPGDVTVRGRVLDANTGRPIEGAVMALLVPGVTAEQFIKNNLAAKLAQAWSLTDAGGIFVLEQVPRGQTYTGFIVTDTGFFWQDGWLAITPTDPDDINLGDIQVSTQ
jgi:hypothetical protein